MFLCSQCYHACFSTPSLTHILVRICLIIICHISSSIMPRRLLPKKIGTFNKLNLLATCLMRSTQSFSLKLSSICFVSFTHVYRTAVFACNRLQILINFFFPHSSLYISDSFRYTSCTGIYGRIAFPKLPYLELLPKHSLTTIPFTSNCPHS